MQLTKKRPLADLFLRAAANAGKRSAAVKPSIWATQYREMAGSFPGPWSFDYHPWLLAMHDDKEEFCVGQKAAQMGYTELMLNLTFYYMDTKQQNVLYVLPAKHPDATDFSSSRFDPAVELSAYLEGIFDTRNAGHKRAGAGNLFIRGSRSKSGLKSVPINLLIIDEIDECTQENIPLALQRTAGQLEHKTWLISTPTIEGYGINYHFQQSTQDHFFFKCQACSRHIELTFPDAFHLVGDHPSDPRLVESYVKCPECKNEIPHDQKKEIIHDGIWVSKEPNRTKRGHLINQLYSSTRKPHQIAELYLKGQTDDTEAQEFNNSVLGETFEAKGARVTEEEINAVVGDHLMSDQKRGGLVTLGIDIGKRIHCVFIRWSMPAHAKGINGHQYCRGKLIKAVAVETIEEVEELIVDFQPVNFVIDAQPEKRASLSLCNKFYGVGKMCYYVNGVIGKTFKAGQDDTEPTINVDRTSWLDLTLGRYRNKTISLPADVDREYRNNIRALTRVIKQDATGNPIATYLKKEHVPDHYAHAQNYCEMALKISLGYGDTTKEF